MNLKNGHEKAQPLIVEETNEAQTANDPSKGSLQPGTAAQERGLGEHIQELQGGFSTSEKCLNILREHCDFLDDTSQPLLRKRRNFTSIALQLIPPELNDNRMNASPSESESEPLRRNLKCVTIMSTQR